MTKDGLKKSDSKLLGKYLSMDSLSNHVEKGFYSFINLEPTDEQQKKIIQLLKEYKERSTSGLSEARGVIKAQIRNDLLTGFNLYNQNANGEVEDMILYEDIKISESNGLIDCIIPFEMPDQLTPREQFSILLHKYACLESNGRDGAFKKLLAKYEYSRKQRSECEYESIRYELNAQDLMEIYLQENPKLGFADKVEVVIQRLYEDIFGLMHIDQLAYSDINEVGFSNNGKYVYCWCGYKIWLSFFHISEKQARVIQDRAISFDKYSMQLDAGNPEILCHRGDGARITVTQKPYFSARNLCIRVFNQSNTAFKHLIPMEKLRILIIALVRSGQSICLQGGLGTGNNVYIVRIIFYIHNYPNQSQLQHILIVYFY